MSDALEFDVKRSRVASWLESSTADAALLTSPASLCWLSAGGDLVRPESAATAFLVQRHACILLCPEDDAERIRQEEVRGFDIEIVPVAGHGPEALLPAVQKLGVRADRIVCDEPGLGTAYDAGLHRLRRKLLGGEIERLRKLARDAATLLESVAAECFRGVAERDAAARVAAECVRAQVAPVCILAGSDARLDSYARPLPKSGTADSVLMLSLIGARRGLHAAVSRTVCFRTPEPDLVQRFNDTLAHLARQQDRSRAGRALSGLLADAATSRCQGGISGYRWLEVEATPACAAAIESADPLVWTVTQRGVRCEETFLAGAGRAELLSNSETWPLRTLNVGDHSYELPDLLLI